MFQITAQTCHAFTLAEVLVMAAMNLESIRLNVEGRLPEAQPGMQATSLGHSFAALQA